MLYNSSFVGWLQRKRYQYNVTMPLYMMTPTERFIFNSIVFLILSLVIIAAALYLPEHISTIARRASFYWAGEDVHGLLREQGVKMVRATASAASQGTRVAVEATRRVAEASASAGRIVDEL